MSEKEKALSLLEEVPDYKMGYVVAFLTGLTADEKTDDDFCEALYQKYLSDPDKGEAYTLEECKKEWGLE